MNEAVAIDRTERAIAALLRQLEMDTGRTVENVIIHQIDLSTLCANTVQREVRILMHGPIGGEWIV